MADAKVDKSEEFAIRIINLYKYLTNEKNEYVISKQILRSGTSIGANIAESLGAESPEDFLHKLAISQKELYETRYWLKLLKRTEYITQEQYNSINADCSELLILLTSIILSNKEKQKK